MTPAQYTALKQELQSDPMGLGYLQYTSVADYTAVAGLLNAPAQRFSKQIPQVPINSVLIWAATGPLQKLYDFGHTLGNNLSLRSICLAAVQLFSTSGYLDLSNPAITVMLQTLVDGGVLSVTDQAGLLALQNVSPASRAEMLFGAGSIVQPFDVQAALR